MRSTTEMTEGQQAFQKFKNAMKAIVTVPKATILAAEKKAKKRRVKPSASGRASSTAH
jgi:hypothetical protein